MFKGLTFLLPFLLFGYVSFDAFFVCFMRARFNHFADNSSLLLILSHAHVLRERLF